MLQSNQPYQRVHKQDDSNSSVWKGAAIGAGVAGLKMAAFEVPIGLALRKDPSTMKDGILKKRN